MNVVDKIVLHKQTGQIIYRDLMKTTNEMGKLHTMVSKIERHMKHERAINRAHQTKIEILEKTIINLGVAVPDQQSVQNIVKSKDTEIKLLKGKLKMPVSKHVQTEEFRVVQQEKEILLEKMMKQGEDLRSYKPLNENLLKEKEDIQSKVDVPVVKIVTDQASEELAKALSQLNLK